MKIWSRETAQATRNYFRKYLRYKYFRYKTSKSGVFTKMKQISIQVLFLSVTITKILKYTEIMRENTFMVIITGFRHFSDTNVVLATRWPFCRRGLLYTWRDVVVRLLCFRVSPRLFIGLRETISYLLDYCTVDKSLIHVGWRTITDSHTHKPLRVVRKNS